MKKTTNNRNATANKYNYAAYKSGKVYKSGKKTIIVWDDLAQMMMGNGLPAQGCRVLKEKGGKEKK